MEFWSFVGDVVLILGAAVVAGVAMQRLGQSPVIGYLLAGLLLGPGALGLVENRAAVQSMAELGIALLLFTIGLEFPWRRLRRYTGVVALAGLGQTLATAAVAGLIAFLFGLELRSAIMVGMIVSLSSTAVVLRVLADRSQIDSVQGIATLGILLVQDVMLVPFLLAAPVLGGDGGTGEALVDFALSLVKLSLLVVAMWALDRLVLQRLLYQAAAGSERELLVLVTLIVSLGAAWATHAMALSPALGAFLAGAFLGTSSFSDQIRAEIAPLHVGLVTLFFVSVGTLADPGYMFENPLAIGGLVLAIVVGKGAIATVATRLARFAPSPSLIAGMALAQIGEFSFVLATSARNEGLIDSDVFQLLVSASLLTLLLTPYVIALGDKLSQRLPERSQVKGTLGERRATEQAGHAVVVGFGPAGRAVVDALVAQGKRVTVIEMNPALGETAHPIGVRAVYGDASRVSVLSAANIEGARLLVTTVPDPATARRVLAQARAMSPDVHLVARGRYNRFLEELHEAGADAVVDEESETGSRLAEAALRHM